jgi:hypothetical protein
MTSQLVRKEYLIRLLRSQAHFYAAAEAPHVSKDAEAMKACADQLEGCDKSSDNSSSKLRFRNTGR